VRGDDGKRRNSQFHSHSLSAFAYNFFTPFNFHKNQNLFDYSSNRNHALLQDAGFPAETS
jgi:hypothetical protein